MSISELRSQRQSRKIIITISTPIVVDISFILVDSNLLKFSLVSVDLKKNKSAAEKFAKKSIITTEKIMFTTETSSKINKPSLYKKALSDAMHIKQ